MDRAYAELAFNGVVVLATGLALVAYVLGLLLDPKPAVGVSLVLVVCAAWLFGPNGRRAFTAVAGLVALLLAGVIIPRFIVGTATGDVLTLVLSLSAVILLLVFAALRLTVFHSQPTNT